MDKNKIIGNYTAQSNYDFPLDCESLDYLRDNQAILELLGNIAGDKVILSGCEPNSAGDSRTAGYVFLRTTDYPEGEILRFEGGQTALGFYVESLAVSVTADGRSYPQAYTRRMLRAGTGNESFQWADFAKLTTTRELAVAVTRLANELENLTAEPVGIVKMYAGTTPPTGYLLCNGTTFNRTEYPELATILGSNTLPNLQGRFIVGYNPSDSDYNAIGNTGGEATHQLTIDEMPPHSHNYSKAESTPPRGDHTGNNTLQTLREAQTSETGGNQAHENRPPYYVLAYIIKAK